LPTLRIELFIRQTHASIQREPSRYNSNANMADSIFQETSHWKDPSTWVIARLQPKGSVGKVPFNFWWIQSTSTRTNKYEGTPLRKTTNDDRSFCFPTTLVWIYGLPITVTTRNVFFVMPKRSIEYLPTYTFTINLSQNVCKYFIAHRIHVWYIYLHLAKIHGKCRIYVYTIHGSYMG